MRKAFHTHTTHSDGLCSVDEIIQLAIQNNIDELAICDHDTISGSLEAQNKLKETNIKLVPGIEISAKNNHLDIPFLNENQSIHMLGYEFNLKDVKFNSQIANIRNKNNDMCLSIITKLKRLYPELDISEVILPPTQKHFYKTDIANYLVSKGIAEDIDEAFSKYINSPLTGNVKTYGISIINSIKYIHDAGGIAIWAHPFDIFIVAAKIRIDSDILEEILKLLIEFGLDGIEVYYEKYNDSQINTLNDLANKYNLLKSCGTDFHGKQGDTYVCSKEK